MEIAGEIETGAALPQGTIEIGCHHVMIEMTAVVVVVGLHGGREGDRGGTGRKTGIEIRGTDGTIGVHRPGTTDEEGIGTNGEEGMTDGDQVSQ